MSLYAERYRGHSRYVSVLIPCHNALGKIGRCLASLRRIDLGLEKYEVIFIDDCSTDGTFELLEALCAEATNWRVIRLDANSGSPSEPRNRGIAEAQGEYVFFLDCDDEILPDTLRLHLDHARQTRADVVRGHLVAENGKTRTTMNRLETWNGYLTVSERVEQILGLQSTVPCSLIRTDLLHRHAIRWRSDLRMGEDTLFLVSVLAAAARIEYIDHPTYIYIKTPNFIPSSTQSYGDRELRDHLVVWREAITTLRPLGIDYVRLRLQIGLQAALNALIFMNRGDISLDTFQDFSAFLNENRTAITEFKYRKRFKDILAVALAGDFTGFRKECRPRLVVAGYDLKFITGILPQLEQFYEIRVDEWKGHDTHDEAKSLELLGWAEFIWCEWLLGNAVWYARNKKPYQKLIVRMHRFELGRDFGDHLASEHVDAVVAVSVLFLERLLERFSSIPRQRARLQHNYVNVSSYLRSQDPERRFRLAMIGILPSRKGYAHALSILAELRRRDPRYTLDIFGHSLRDVSWLANDSGEVSYYRNCEEFIADNDLSDSVRLRGHTNVQTALAEYGTGIVLSLSDSVRQLPCFESFHLAIADGFAAGGLSLARYWEGVEYVWPSRFILPSDNGIIERILNYRNDPSLYAADCRSGFEFVSEKYSVDKFIKSFRDLFSQAG